MPPVCGNALDSSASVSAPHSANSPPAAHTSSIGTGPGRWFAITAGVRKMPEPMTVPISTAIALSSPSWRGSEERGVWFMVGHGTGRTPD